jgi:hypothetical protein
VCDDGDDDGGCDGAYDDVYGDEFRDELVDGRHQLVIVCNLVVHLEQLGKDLGIVDNLGIADNKGFRSLDYSYSFFPPHNIL